MAKSFKNLFNEVAQPKAGEEKAFKDQHTVQKFDAVPAGQDHIFTGNIETKKRLADIMKGQDVEKYDAAYVKKTDVFQMPRNIDEEAIEELEESPFEEKEMMMGQLRAMSHYIQGIAQYIRTCDDCEEWYQNKLSGVAKEMSTLYGYATSETHSMMGEEKVGDECDCCGGTITKDGTCGCGPDCEHCGGQHDISESNYASQFAEAMSAKETELDEARGTSAKYAGKSGVFGGKYTSTDRMLDMKNFNKIREELDNLEEKFKFKQSTLELDSGEKIKLSRQDADLLTKFFGDLNSRNSKEMHKVLTTDKSGFQEILSFAREAL